MMKMRLWLSLGLALLSGACSSQDEVQHATAPTGLRDMSRADVSPLASQPFTGLTLDEMLARVDELSPGFAGMYWAPGDSVVIMHRGNPSLPVVLDAVRQVMGENSPAFRAKGVRLQPVRYSFSELAFFRAQLERLQGWITSDVDEFNNHVAIGVESEALRQQFLAAATGLKIPGEALAVLIEQRPKPMTYLGDRLDTTKAGISIAVKSPPGYGAGWCSLGFNYTHWSSTTYFITNGHCSYNRNGNGVLDTNVVAAQIHHDNSYSFFPFPVEARMVENPPYTTQSGCPTTTCRYSDAAGYRWQTPQVVGLGKVAFTLWDNYGWNGAGDSLIYGTWNITTEIPDHLFIPRQYISRIGITSGWTTGEILRSCFDMNISNGLLLCQFRADMYSDEGDSGGPVFTYSNNVNESAIALGGIMHSRSPTDYSIPFPYGGGTYFSSITGIQRDFGSLKTYPAK